MSDRQREAARRILAGLAGLTLLFAVAPSAASAAESPTARLLGAGSGRFEVVAEPGADGVRLAELAAAAWTEWSGPLGLPARLPVAITVRLVPESGWPSDDLPWRVVVEPTGVASVWIRAGGESGVVRERRWLSALAEGVLRRRALLEGVALEKVAAPTWLVAAAAEAMIVAERPSMLDAWQAEVAQETNSATLRDVLFWAKRGSVSSDEPRRRAAFGIWLWLREESGRSGSWERLVGALLAGETPGVALAREFSRMTRRPTEAREWELAWRVAKARLIALRLVPMMNAAESRLWIERVARVVAVDTRTGEERVATAWGEWGLREEPWMLTERAERARLMTGNFAQIHPFYRNAAGSLGRAWVALAEGREKAWREASMDWARDMETGRALEDASRRLLDGVSKN